MRITCSVLGAALEPPRRRTWCPDFRTSASDGLSTFGPVAGRLRRSQTGLIQVNCHLDIFQLEAQSAASVGEAALLGSTRREQLQQRRTDAGSWRDA